MDYSKILDNKTKRRLLMDRFENQKNTIQYYIDEHEAEEVIPDMEELVMMMEQFLENHFKDTIGQAENNEGENDQEDIY